MTSRILNCKIVEIREREPCYHLPDVPGDHQRRHRRGGRRNPRGRNAGPRRRVPGRGIRAERRGEAGQPGGLREYHAWAVASVDMAHACGIIWVREMRRG